MQDAPEQIWAWKWDFPYARKVNGKCEWSSVAYPQEQAVTKYITEAECQRRVVAERAACAAIAKAHDFSVMSNTAADVRAAQIAAAIMARNPE